MKKIIKKFWGVGLIVVLLSSLFVAAAPVSAADPLNWEYKTDAPTWLFYGLDAGSDVLDYAFSGMTGYAATGAMLLQSGTGGGIWADITSRLPADISTVNYVTMAPDDPNVVLVGDAIPSSGLCLAISVNGGATFTSMGIVSSSNTTGAHTATAINGITVSPVVTGGIRYIVAYGNDGTHAGLYFYNYGAGVGFWYNAVIDGGVNRFPVLAGGYTDCVGFAFSPNFASDYMATALMTDGSDILDFHILSFNYWKWDAVVAAGYPTTVYTSATSNLTINKASIALIPDYDGSDDSLRIAFVGASMDDDDGSYSGEIGGVWRCYDSAPPVKIYGSTQIGSGTGIASVATDGTNLAAGAYATNNVFRTADPLTTTPTFLPARNYKKIGVDDAGDDIVILKFDGATLYGGKQGDASCISKSLDYGNVWNDFTLLDNEVVLSPVFGLTNAVPDDIWFSATGDPYYVAAHDATTAAIYRVSMYAVTRILCVYPTDATGFNLRGLASDGNVLYGFDNTAPQTTIFYTSDGGLSRWYKRANAPAAITDLAVESAQVIYIANGINVYKSINSGFTWGLPVNSQLTSGNTVNNIVSLGEGLVLIGGTLGGVVYSTDSGATWIATMGTLDFQPILVQATGLSAGDYIFAAETTTTSVFRCELGPSNPFGEFKNMNAPAQIGGEVNTGFALTNGVLYVISSNITTTYVNRTLAPAIPGTHSAIFWGTQYAESNIVMNVGKNALRTSSGAPGDIMLYGFSNGDGLTTLSGVYYYQDTLALNGPVLIGPADKDKVEVISALTGAAQPVNFTWQRLSKATGYNLFIALDANFYEIVTVQPVASTLDPVSYIANTNLLNPTFAPGNTYYWRVAVSTPIGSAFSETRSFTIQPTAASVPTIGGPASGTTIDTLKPAFSWSPVAGTTTYQFQLSEGTAFAAPIYDTEVSVAGAQLPLTITLEDGKTYFWRVKALSPVEGDWSTIANFTIALPVVTTPTPPVTITNAPPVTITIPPAPAATTLTIPPAEEKVINPAYIWVIIIIGAILVIAVIVLIVRTRRSV
jgi:hypothetical protein